MGGSIYLYPYIDLDAAGNPILINGAPKIIAYGASIETSNDLSFKTLSRGNIELINHNSIKADSIMFEARGSIIINNSEFESEDDIVFNTMKNPEITGDRSIRLDSTLLSSNNPNKKVKFETKADILFKGGGWSSNQMLYIPDDINILFAKANEPVKNLGSIDVGSTGRMFFENSMVEDLSRPLRIRLERDSNDSFLLTTINYNRNVAYANHSNKQQIVLSGLWAKLGSGNHNYEFTARVLKGPGDVNDLAYSYDGNGNIKIDVITTVQRLNTRVKFDVRDRFNNDIIGSGYFNYSVSSGQPTIDVEEPPPMDYYTITFNTNGGSEIAPIGGYVDEDVGTVLDPTRTGYEFIGWDIPLPTKIPAQDLELSAIWKSIKYTITFVSNGGPAISNMTYIYGEQVSIPNPSRTGYTFFGWNKTPPATMPAEDLEFIAQWTQKTLIITFDSNGGSATDPSSEQGLFDSAYVDLPLPSPSPTREGFTLDGWYTQRIGGTKIDADTMIKNAENHSIFAQWVIAHQQLEFIDIEPKNQRNNVTLFFNNNIKTVIDTDLGNSYLNVVDQQVRYSYTAWFSNTSQGSYYVTVRDVFNQELRVNLELERFGNIFNRYWEWKVTSVIRL